MSKKMNFPNNCTFSEYDQKKICTFFKNSTYEQVLLLGAGFQDCNPLKVSIQFSFPNSSTHDQSKRRVLFSMAPIASAMQYCKSHNISLLIIHNHAYGAIPSESDKDSFEIIKGYADQHALQYPLFAIFDMSNNTISLI